MQLDETLSGILMVLGMEDTQRSRKAFKQRWKDYLADIDGPQHQKNKAALDSGSDADGAPEKHPMTLHAKSVQSITCRSVYA